MFLLKIANKSLFLSNFIFQNRLIYFSHKISILELIQKEIFSFYLN